MSDINAYTTAEIANLTPQSGDLVLNTDDNAVQLWNGSAWKIFNSDVSPFSSSYSVSFDGTNDTVDAVSNPNLDVYTASLWLKTTQTAFNLPISGFGRGVYNNYGGIRLNAGAGRTIEINDGTSYIKCENVASGDLNDGAWHNITAVYVPSGYTTSTGTATNSGQGYKIFLDGTRVDTGLGSTGHNFGLMATTSDFKLGREGPRTLYWFNGLIDDVAIFGSSLSDSDVTAIYNNGAPTDLASYSPTLWWQMGDNDNGTGTTITDQGSAGVNGTLTNGPTFSTDTP